MNKLTGFTEIEIGGKKRPVKYGWNALALLEQKIGINTLNPADLMKASRTASVQLIIAEIGLIEGCRVQKIAPDFSQEDIADWFDAEGFRRVQEFVKLFGDAISDASMIGLSDDEKKSLAKLKLGMMSGELPSENSDSLPANSGT